MMRAIGRRARCAEARLPLAPAAHCLVFAPHPVREHGGWEKAICGEGGAVEVGEKIPALRRT
jgi:hypothetical protein